MLYRKKTNPKKDKRIFKKTAKKTNTINTKVSRGGVSLWDHIYIHSMTQN